MNNEAHNDSNEGYEIEAHDDSFITKMFLISLAAIAFVAVVAVTAYFLFAGKNDEIVFSDTKSKDVKVRAKSNSIKVPKVVFTDITEASGISFKHVNGAYGDKLLPETMGGGVAFFDYDNDGDQDIFLVNSCQWPDHKEKYEGKPDGTMALYQNDGTGKFTDVSKESGLNVCFYGMGVAVGDFDGDGWQDLYVTAVGKNHLFKNDNGKFSDVTDATGTAGNENDWGTSCGWIDYDQDGLLDLFVCNYVVWSETIDLGKESTLDGKVRAYAPVKEFGGTQPILFRNIGDGKFEDATEKANLITVKFGQPVAKSLGLSFFDLSNDGYLDIFVANDTKENLVFIYQPDTKTFSESAIVFNLANAADGQARGAMGIDIAKFRSDESVGVIIGNFANEPASLYVAGPDSLSYGDEANSTGLGPQTRGELTFGMFFFDYDLDGRLDILTANGHLENEISRLQGSQTYEQSPRLFWNAGEEERTEFVPIGVEESSEDLLKPLVGRGATCADIDGDGDLDILITNSGGTPRLLRNDQEINHHWLRVKLTAKGKNQNALGAIATLHVGDRKLVRSVAPTFSYLSQRELPITFGLGKDDTVEKLVIRWPDGSEQVATDLKIDALNEISQSE